MGGRFWLLVPILAVGGWLFLIIGFVCGYVVSGFWVRVSDAVWLWLPLMVVVSGFWVGVSDAV